MTATNSTSFNRFSSNIAEDGAIAVFDVLPTSNINDPGIGDEYANDVVSMRGSIPWLAADTRFFEVPSSHCSKRSNAYYLNRKGTRYTEFPSVSGIPMNYGGAPLARYKALSEDIVNREPLMLVPSFGMTHDYADRARSFEMWLNMEPYAQAARLNVLPDNIADCNLAANTYIWGGAPPSHVTDGSEWNAVSALTETIFLPWESSIEFLDQFMVAGGRKYTFGMAISGLEGSKFVVNISVEWKHNTWKTYSREIVLTDFGQFNNLFGEGFSIDDWGYYTFDIIFDDTFSGNSAKIDVWAEHDNMISDMQLIDVAGEVVETVVWEQDLIEFGGLNGSRVKITADADFMYLNGYGNVSNFQVGEWARPMYLVCVDNDKTFDVYVDCALVMSITKDVVVETYGTVKGEYILLSIGESFKYVDISTMSIYSGALGQDIQRIHYLFGYGPKYNDVLNHHPHETVYVADGSATTFASNVLFPQTTEFGIGESSGLEVSDQLTLPDYDFPQLINGSLDDTKFYNVSYNIQRDGYGPQIFQFPDDSEAVLVPEDIVNNPDYIFIMASPFKKPNVNLLTENQATATDELWGTSGFSATSSTIASAYNAGENGDNQALSVTATGDYSGVYMNGSGGSGTMPVTAGKAYSLFSRVKTDGTTLDIYPIIRWFESDGTTIIGGLNQEVYSVDDTWTTVSCSFTAPPTAEYASLGFYAHVSVPGNVFYLDSIKFCEGLEMIWTNPSYESSIVPDYPSGLITRISSGGTGFNCNIVFAEVEDDNSVIDIRANIAYPFSVIDYDGYSELYPSYGSDPNYQKATYTQIAGEAAPFFSVRVPRRNFLLALNITELRDHEDRDVAAIFNDSNLKYRFNDTSLYTYIAVSSREAVLGNDIISDPDNDLPSISVESATDDGTVSTSIIGKATYALYPNAETLDIAATGLWQVSIPLTNFATFVGNTPDIDFLIYSDQGQSPQLVNSLQTDIMSYDEFERYIGADFTGLDLPVFSTEFANSDFGGAFGSLESTGDLAKYSDVKELADQNDLAYNQMGIDVDTSEASLGRFANRAIRTFVTLDSPVRWPDKEYVGLDIEWAGYNDYIDFDNSPNSVLTTRWEIFDGYAIRIPKNINLYKYNIRLAVHMLSLSLNTRKPTFRRADLFGVASGDRPRNQISVGSGSYLVIGDNANLDRSFSTHLITETLPANYMSRELGFYPHGYSDNGTMAPVHYYLTEDDQIKGFSFYINWRAETFRTVVDPVSGLYEDKIGYLKYLDSNNDEFYIDLGVETIAPTVTPWLADLKASPDTNTTIWVDGLNDTKIEAGKWHQVYIDLTADGTIPLSDAARSTVFSQTNEKAVMNYVTSHSTIVSPTNLHASRFGLTDQAVFADDFGTSLHYGVSDSLQITDDAEIITVTRPVDPDTSGASSDAVVRIGLDDNSAVV